MTKPEAKALMTEVWGYLAKHPECERKEDLPPYLYDKIKDCYFRCPLCELLKERSGCYGCILNEADSRCLSPNAPFRRWEDSPKGEAGNAIRAFAAKDIADISEAWNTEEDG
jgi:hypothetical protein